MGRKIVDYVADMIRHGVRMDVECRRCGHAGRFYYEDLRERCRGAQSRRIEAVARRMVCSQCGCRDIRARIERVGE